MGAFFTGAGDCSHRFILIVIRQSLLWLLHLTMYGLLNPLTQMFYSTFIKKIVITSITYTIANDYYMHTYWRDRKTRKLRTEAEKWDPMITSTNEFRQVMPFSLFHCASNAPQTKKIQALSVTLTHRNKTEMPYQVMRNIAENGCNHRPTLDFRT
jgi:hypothetical protein